MKLPIKTRACFNVNYEFKCDWWTLISLLGHLSYQMGLVSILMIWVHTKQKLLSKSLSSSTLITIQHEILFAVGNFRENKLFLYNIYSFNRCLSRTKYGTESCSSYCVYNSGQNRALPLASNILVAVREND